MTEPGGTRHPPLIILGTTSLSEGGGGLGTTLPKEAAEFLKVGSKSKVLWALDPAENCVRVYSTAAPADLGGRPAEFRFPDLPL